MRFSVDCVTSPKTSTGLLARFARDEGGATSIEYALIAVLVSVGLIVGATAIGLNLADVFNRANEGFAG